MSHQPIDLAKIREGDTLMREARRLDPHVRLPSHCDLERILPVPKSTEKPTGRPRTAEPTITIALRITETMAAELDAHVGRLERQTGMKATRTDIARHALRLYLEEEPALSKPKSTAAKRAKG